jgi:catalase
MSLLPRSSLRELLGSFALIAGVIAGVAVAFAYTAGWLSPRRLTPERLVASLAPPGGPALGHRRNHAKGICFTGVFEANGNGTALSTAYVFTRGEYPVVGRFNLGTPDPEAKDASVRVRGMGLRITTSDGQEWRMALIDPPFFPVSTPQAFYALQRASASKAPDAMKQFAADNPEFGNFAAWAKAAPWTASYAEDRYNSIDSFIFTDEIGVDRVVRWSLLPLAQASVTTQAELAKLGPDFLEQEIAQRVSGAPARWTMVVTVANSGDPTADPSKAWPDDRRSVEVGTLTVRQVEPERDGPCRDVNFDPTVLPAGMRASDDPFPAARSSAYRESYDLRTAETNDYPYREPRVKP